MSEVHDIYFSLLKKGLDPKDAAVLAQEQTGNSLVTGQPIRQKKLKFTSKGVTYGQYPAFKSR